MIFMLPNCVTAFYIAFLLVSGKVFLPVTSFEVLFALENQRLFFDLRTKKRNADFQNGERSPLFWGVVLSQGLRDQKELIVVIYIGGGGPTFVSPSTWVLPLGPFSSEGRSAGGAAARSAVVPGGGLKNTCLEEQVFSPNWVWALASVAQFGGNHPWGGVPKMNK